MNTTKIESTSQKQRGVFAIDHRLIVCDFYRVSSAKGHRTVLRVVRDGGANPTQYNVPLGNQLRREFNKQGWAYVSDAIIPEIAVELLAK